MRCILLASSAAALIASLLLTGGCSRQFLKVKPPRLIQPRGVVVVNPPGPGKVVIAGVRPPAPRVEVRGVAPSPKHAWVSGHWAWSSGRYGWKPGHWIVRPRPRVEWVAGKWVESGGGWKWVPGHWR